MGNSCCTKKVKNPIQKPDIPIENKKSENSSQFKKDGKESYRRSIKNRVGVIEKGSKVSDETSETRFASISELKVT